VRSVTIAVKDVESERYGAIWSMKEGELKSELGEDDVQAGGWEG
jgi:hypothetical protein